MLCLYFNCQKEFASQSLTKMLDFGGVMLGNVVISKKILSTRKIMVMHSNQRGECCPRTLVDPKQKRYDNVVDVVVCLHVDRS